MATQEEIVKVQFIVTGTAEAARLAQEIDDLKAALDREKAAMLAAEEIMRAAGASQDQIARGTATNAAVIADGMTKLANAVRAMKAAQSQVAATTDSMLPPVADPRLDAARAALAPTSHTATPDEIVRIQVVVAGEEEIRQLQKEIKNLDALIAHETQQLLNNAQAMRAAGATEAQVAQGTQAHAQVIAKAMNQMAASQQAMQAAQTRVGMASQGINPAAQAMQVTHAMDKAGEASKHMSGSTIMALQQVGFAIDDLQYGFRGVVNNVQAATMAMGAWGVAISIGIVAANQLYERWDEISSLWGQGKTETQAQHMEALAKATEKTVAQTMELAKLQREEATKTTIDEPKKTAKDTRSAVEEALRETGPGSDLAMNLLAAEGGLNDRNRAWALNRNPGKLTGRTDYDDYKKLIAEEKRYESNKTYAAQEDMAVNPLNPFGGTYRDQRIKKLRDLDSKANQFLLEEYKRQLAAVAEDPSKIEEMAVKLEAAGKDEAARRLRSAHPVERAIVEGEKEREALNETLFSPEARRKRIEDVTAGPPAELGRAPREKAMDELVADIQSDTGLDQVVAGDIKEAQAKKWLEALGLDPKSIENYLPDVLAKLQAIGRRAVDQAVANSERERERVNADLERMAESERAKRISEAKDLATSAADELQGNLPGLGQDVKNAMIADMVAGRGVRRNKVGLMETVPQSLDMSSSRAASILSKQIQEERPGVGPMEAMAEARKIVERERRNVLAEGRQAFERIQERAAMGQVPGKGIQTNTLMGGNEAMQTAREGADKQWWDLTREAAKAQIYLAEMARRNGNSRYATVAPRR